MIPPPRFRTWLHIVIPKIEIEILQRTPNAPTRKARDYLP
jgi:hypothetical protein